MEALKTFTPDSPEDWRQWLQKNHDKEQSVWLICHKKHTGMPSITHSEAVDEALCFGWIDSTRISVGPDSFRQYFGRRKPGSTWSKVNKAKVDQLIAAGKMQAAGYASIATAKGNGSWALLDDVEALKIPKDLLAAFKTRPGAKTYFEGLSKSVRKMMLQWLVLAKRPETCARKIETIADAAALQQRPRQF